MKTELTHTFHQSELEILGLALATYIEKLMSYSQLLPDASNSYYRAHDYLQEAKDLMVRVNKAYER